MSWPLAEVAAVDCTTPAGGFGVRAADDVPGGDATDAMPRFGVVVPSIVPRLKASVQNYKKVSFKENVSDFFAQIQLGGWWAPIVFRYNLHRIMLIMTRP